MLIICEVIKKLDKNIAIMIKKYQRIKSASLQWCLEWF